MAIKLLKNIFRNEIYTKRVISEIQIMRKLSSIPNNIFTVKLLDLIYSEDTHYIFIVMDYVEFDIKKVLKST